MLEYGYSGRNGVRYGAPAAVHYERNRRAEHGSQRLQGMAAYGARPWVFSFATFLAYRAADHIRVLVVSSEFYSGGVGLE